MRRALVAVLTSAVIATVCTAVPVSAATPPPMPAVAMPGCDVVAAGPVSSDRDAAGWTFAAADGGGHSYRPGALELRSGAGGTSVAARAVSPALPLSEVGDPAVTVASSSGVTPVLTLQIELDGVPAGALHQGDAGQWWADEALPGVPVGDHAADGTLEQIVSGVTGAGSTIDVTDIAVVLGADTAAAAAVSAVTAGCVRYSFTAISAAARIGGSAVVGRQVTADLGGWSPAPVSASYQWRVGVSAVSTAATYLIRPSDYGKGLSLVVTASGPGYSGVVMTAGPAVVGAGSFVTAAPAIVGTAKVGAALTVSLSRWTPATTSVRYRWNRSGTPIAGATGTSYTPTAADRGATITVTATGSALGYTTASVTSRGAVVGFGTLTAPAPSITGSVRVGSTVRVATGTWSPAVTTRTYQWRINGSAVTGATATAYTPRATDRGKRLSVTVTGSRPGYAILARTSASLLVGAGLFAAATPKITGTPQVGTRLTVTRGTWTPAPATVTYQWRRNGIAIKGATHTTYTPTATDWGKRISVTVTGSRAGYTTRSVTSGAVAVTRAFSRTSASTITGTGRVGSTLTAHVAAWSPSASLSYQWRRDGRALPGATRSTYLLQAADHGHRMSVTVTGRRAGYTTGSRTSGATAAIAWPVGVTTPAVTKQPRSTEQRTGATVTMSVSATGGRLYYQWQHSADGKRWDNVTGQTSPTMTLRVTTARSGYYRARVGNMVATKYSASAVLLVLSSRADPYRPGQLMVLTQWMAVLGSSRLARADDGTLVVAAPVTVGYFGSGSAYPWLDLSIEYVGSNGVVYGNDLFGFDDSIWGSNEVYSGAVTGFTAYIGVPSSVVKGGVWRITDSSDWSNTTVQYVKGY